MISINQWTLEGFVDHFGFVHHKMRDHKFVWTLGAGASHSSGIPLGSQLVDRWLSELHLKEADPGIPVEKWATADRLDIKGFDYADRATFYPRVYERRFNGYPEEGYAYLENVMSGKDPSPGYSILAAALAMDPARHNVVITTNFDNLVADALSIYTDTFPFVAGHESLTSFVRVAMRRPLICKIHRDLLLAPQSDPRSLKRLNDAWGSALRALFQHYTPLIIGYGGNDDTLMDLLESLQATDIKGQLIWCYYEKGEPTERIKDLVSGLNGILVPVPDFDLLMVLLGEKMGISTLDEEIELRAERRTMRYRHRIQRLDTIEHPSVAKALAATFERSGGWWVWHQKAQIESDPKRREIVYRQGLQHCPASAELIGAFAVFMGESGQFEEAEELFRRALKIDPTNPITTGNFAVFLSDYLGKHDEAAELHEKSLQLSPKDIDVITNYAEFAIKRRLLPKAKQLLDVGKGLSKKKTAMAAVLAFQSAILARLTKEDDSVAIDELKRLFETDFPREPYLFGEILAFVKDALPDEHEMFSAIAAGIQDSSQVPNLEELLRRRGVNENKVKSQVAAGGDGSHPNGARLGQSPKS